MSDDDCMEIYSATNLFKKCMCNVFGYFSQSVLSDFTFVVIAMFTLFTPKS